MSGGAATGSVDAGILIKGVLEKRGGWNTAWKERFFMLESCGRLSYFKSEEDIAFPQRAKGSIPINTTITVKEGEVNPARMVEILDSNSKKSTLRCFRRISPTLVGGYK